MLIENAIIIKYYWQQFSTWRVDWINLLFGETKFTIFVISQSQKLFVTVIYTREICPTFRPGFCKIAKLKYLLNKGISKLQINNFIKALMRA